MTHCTFSAGSAKSPPAALRSRSSAGARAWSISGSGDKGEKEDSPSAAW